MDRMFMLSAPAGSTGRGGMLPGSAIGGAHRIRQVSVLRRFGTESPRGRQAVDRGGPLGMTARHARRMTPRILRSCSPARSSPGPQKSRRAHGAPRLPLRIGRAPCQRPQPRRAGCCSTGPSPQNPVAIERSSTARGTVSAIETRSPERPVAAARTASNTCWFQPEVGKTRTDVVRTAHPSITEQSRSAAREPAHAPPPNSRSVRVAVELARRGARRRDARGTA